MQMKKTLIVVDCDDATLTQDLCAAFASYPSVQAILPSHPHASAAEVACCWFPDPLLLSHSPDLKLVQAASAGVDHLPATLFTRDIPLCRVVDDNFRHGMFEYALWGVLNFQRYFDRARRHQQQKQWQLYPQRPNTEYRVGVMGLGEIGGYIAQQLSLLGYPVSGWSRSEKKITGVSGYVGYQQLDAFCHSLDVVINVLPLTEQTRGLIATPFLQKLPPGAALINCGRGEHMVNDDVRAALDQGQLCGALLDVFPVEPLPVTDPLWEHPRVTITPHMASSAQVSVIAAQLVDNITRLQQQRPLRHQVDTQHGY